MLIVVCVCFLLLWIFSLLFQNKATNIHMYENDLLRASTQNRFENIAFNVIELLFKIHSENTIKYWNELWLYFFFAWFACTMDIVNWRMQQFYFTLVKLTIRIELFDIKCKIINIEFSSIRMLMLIMFFKLVYNCIYYHISKVLILIVDCSWVFRLKLLEYVKVWNISLLKMMKMRSIKWFFFIN